MEEIENIMLRNFIPEPGENKPRAHCYKCKDPIYWDDMAFEFDGEIVCDSCLYDYACNHYRLR